MLVGLIAFLGAVLVAFLPPRYRRRFYSAHSGDQKAAVASGIIQVVASILFLIARALTFFSIPPDVDLAKAAFEGKLAGASFPGSGIFAFFGFFFQPINLFATYM